jgi:hypothetical protein
VSWRDFFRRCEPADLTPYQITRLRAGPALGVAIFPVLTKIPVPLKTLQGLEFDKRQDECIWTVKQLLFQCGKSPPLGHIRDPHSLSPLTLEVVKRFDHGNSI